MSRRLLIIENYTRIESQRTQRALCELAELRKVQGRILH